jgi:hypothetical protein
MEYHSFNVAGTNFENIILWPGCLVIINIGALEITK